MNQVELLIALSAEDTLAPEISAETTTLPKVIECEAAYADQIKVASETVWLLASVEPFQPIIYGVSSSNLEPIKVITLITDGPLKEAALKDSTAGLWSNRNLSTYRVKCAVNEAKLILSLQFDPQSRLVAAGGFHSAAIVEPVEITEKRAEIAHTLACAPAQQVASSVNTRRLPAALSLRFEHDEQQTP